MQALLYTQWHYTNNYKYIIDIHIFTIVRNIEANGCLRHCRRRQEDICGS